MCGIAGFCDFGCKLDAGDLSRMVDAVKHRGPDGSGTVFHAESYGHVGLGHTRLAVIDLTKNASQPMKFDDVEIVYNGEVYNFSEIRDELISVGYSFKSRSDTEVVLKAYHKWGLKFVDRLNGMFAMALFDRKKKLLICLRDRVGVKPFYFYWKNNVFLFASELRSFHELGVFEKTIDKEALALYMQYGFVPQPYSIFKNAQKLKAGHILEFDLKNCSMKQINYWNATDVFAKEKIEVSQHEALSTVDSLISKSCSQRLIADVPVGVFLSGGYDSSLVAAKIKDLGHNVNTFTVGFEEKRYDESNFARNVANHIGTNHTEVICTQEDAKAILPKLCDIYDEPFGDSSAIPTILVCELARKDVTVALSADGGDEVFGGYQKYQRSLYYKKRLDIVPYSIRHRTSQILALSARRGMSKFLGSRGNILTKFNKLMAMLSAKNTTEIMDLLSVNLTKIEASALLFDKPEKMQTIVKNTSFLDGALDQMLAQDFQTYLVDDILTKVDRASMSIGLESREPLLDTKLVEYAFRLPDNCKIFEGGSKLLLKSLTHKYVPQSLLNRPKKGFSVPVLEWFRQDLGIYLLHYLSRERLDRHKLFNSDMVVSWRDQYLEGQNDNIQRLWFILMFELWFERWM